MAAEDPGIILFFYFGLLGQKDGRQKNGKFIWFHFRIFLA